MIVSVRGAKDSQLTKMLKLAAHSYADKLLSPQLSKNITVQVRIRERGQINAGGFCEMDEDTLVSPRCFNIDIGRTKKKIHMFTILAHEMVHLKQWATGEMKDRYLRRNYVTIWRGETYQEDHSYWDQPWEIEAYGLENSLVAKFLIEHDQFKNIRQKQQDWFVYETDDELDEWKT